MLFGPLFSKNISVWFNFLTGYLLVSYLSQYTWDPTFFISHHSFYIGANSSLRFFCFLKLKNYQVEAILVGNSTQ